MTFGPHIKNITNKANTRLNTLRALGGTNFGKDKETLTLVYKQYIRAVMSYASPTWAPSLAKGRRPSTYKAERTTCSTSTNRAKRALEGARIIYIRARVARLAFMLGRLS